MSLRLYLLRHGETEFSKTGGYCGSLDPELNEDGRRMAAQFAETYRTLPWAGVYASPMKRTVATARPLCEAAVLPMTLREGLREIAYGEWEGITHDDAKARYPDAYLHWMTEPAWYAPPGGETAQEINARASAVVSEVMGAHPDGNVLVVSHKATIRVLLCGFLGIDLGRYRDRLDVPAGSVSVVRIATYGPMLERLGDRSYMSADLQAQVGT
jgi:probable phosphoglycerate mutase